MTDQAKIYNKLGTEFARHDTVNHQEDEYVRREGETIITTNTIESYFSVFKRGMRAPINIAPRSICIVIWRNLISVITTALRLAWMIPNAPNELAKGIVGKRLTYRRPNRKHVHA